MALGLVHPDQLEPRHLQDRRKWAPTGAVAIAQIQKRRWKVIRSFRAAGSVITESVADGEPLDEHSCGISILRSFSTAPSARFSRRTEISGDLK